jgi:hypothetical protein
MGVVPLPWPDRSGTNDSANQQTYTAGNFFRIFEFLTVPSRFSGMQQVHRHSTFNNAAAPPPKGGVEHMGWPFTAPFNYLSVYREPGRVNLNTIPMAPNRGTGAPSYVANPEHTSDEGAIVWRAVTNEFHPIIRWMNTTPVNNGYSRGYNRANTRNNPADLNVNSIYRYSQVGPNLAKNLPGSALEYPWNPSQDFATNFHNLFASIHSDSPWRDPRGPNAQPNLSGGGGDDTYNLPIESRHDPERPSLFNNPFRSFMEGFGAVAPSLPNTGFAVSNVSQNQAGPGASAGPVQPTETYLSYATLGIDPNNPKPNPLLQIDSTLLRRRDTTWNPWEMDNSTPWPLSPIPVVTTTLHSNVANNTPAQYDVAFDPLFALNFPRPFHWSAQLGLPVTGYSMSLFYRGNGDPSTNGQDENSFITGNTNADSYLARTTDYRNTDRNPFFRYQLYNKLGNIATTRSNVYAIWITVGFFEVEKVYPNQALPSQEDSRFGYSFTRDKDQSIQYRFPTGYRILREVGSDTGETIRHKLFAIYDRTIPVGFLRGENLNADQAFLVRRILY